MFEFLNGIGIVPLLGGALLFIAIILMVMGATAVVAERQFFLRRLMLPQDASELSNMPYRRGILLEDGLLKRFDSLVTPKNLDELTQTRRRLIQAGYRRPSAARIFYVARAGFPLGFAFLAGLSTPFLPAAIPTPIIGLIILFAFLVGFLVPAFWVQREIEYRRQSAELGFPDLLDMLLVCIEAGNSLDQAARRVSREIKSVNRVLADELSVVNDELYAGKTRSAVFRDFAERLSVPDISAFAAVLRQSDEFGVSIAETLRVYASELRNKRIMRAEEKANMMPVKLALGSIVFTIPPTMLIMAGPSIIMILRAFAGLGGQ